MESKICTKCNISKLISEFYFRKDSGKHRNHCISCEKKRLKNFYSDNTESRKVGRAKYYKENKEECDKKYKEFRKTEKRISYTKEYNKSYRAKNKNKLNLTIALKKKINPLFKLKCDTRSLISQYFKNKGFSKTSKTANILGCTFEEFKIHIEKQFEYWMNWDNHGIYDVNCKTWQLDHIIPVSIAKNRSDLIKLNHFSNFQPLCSIKNNIKSNNL